MNRYLLLMTGLSVAQLLAREPANVTMYCTSLRFASATGGPGQALTVTLGTDPTSGNMNGEVAPLYDPALPSHGTFFVLEDPAFPDVIGGRMAFDKPSPLDANGNGFDDFYESSMPVMSTVTQGFFSSVVDTGDITATWSRTAGSTTGTCTLRLVGDTFGALPDFTHTFELLEFSGKMAYTPAVERITGDVKVSQTGAPLNTLSGLLVMTRVQTNRFNQLVLQSGSLTNNAGQGLPFGYSELERDVLSKTNYYGFLDFSDWDPTSGSPDYIDWVLSIDDTNDENGNGIPDLTDDPEGTAAPRLEIARGPSNLLLTVRAAPGQYSLEEATTLGKPWTVSSSVTVTNNPQVLQRPLPETATRFWRLRAP